MSEHESNVDCPSRWSLYLSFALCVDHLSLSIIQRRYYSMSAIWIMNSIPLLLCASGIWVEASSAIEYFAPKAVWSTLVMSGNVKKQPRCSIIFWMVWVIKLCDGHISSFWTKTLFTRRIDTSPMRTTKTPPTLSMLSSFASVFLFVSCNRRIRSGLHQMTQLLNKKRTNFANTLLSPDEDDDDDHNEAMMWTYIALAATSSLFPPSVFQHMKSPRLLGEGTNFKRWNFPDQFNSKVLIPTWSWRIALDIGTLYSEPGVKAIP